MGLGSFIRLLVEAPKFAQQDEEAVKRAGLDTAKLAKYHRTIVIAGGCGAAVGAVAGIIMLVVALKTPQADVEHHGGEALALPVFTTVIGMFAGVGFAGALAPRSFLESPLGEKWMNLIGTKKVSDAKIIAWLVAIIGVGLFVFLCVCAAMGQF